ncbi:MAG: sensor histidine kinase [Eubacterium sp.]|nr:sensor histidine kinase [Eubacterium sp.]
MSKSLKNEKKRLSLVNRIRISYVIPFVPIIIMLSIIYYNLWQTNAEYSTMIDSVVKASSFSLDFKHDIDYETYLLIIGQKNESTTPLLSMIKEARDVVDDLMTLTNTAENRERLDQMNKYLDNLNIYIESIFDNARSEEVAYDENMQIWENDVQVGTSLLQEAFYQYIYYEVKDLERERDEQLSINRGIFTGSVVMMIITAALVIIISYYFNRLLRQVRHEQIRLRKAELLVLQSQINPHFLYNTLDAITWLAESGEQATVVSMVGSLSEFFRASLGQGKDMVSLAEDVHHIRSYLEIQKIRYQDIMDYNIDIPEEYGDVPIPKLTLQPLVENALYHGIKNKRGGGTIKVYAKAEAATLFVYVEDDGAGMDAARLEQVREGISRKAPQETGIYGIYNVNERIRLYFGEEYGLSIDSEEGSGSISTVSLPLSGVSAAEYQ